MKTLNVLFNRKGPTRTEIENFRNFDQILTHTPKTGTGTGISTTFLTAVLAVVLIAGLIGIFSVSLLQSDEPTETAALLPATSYPEDTVTIIHPVPALDVPFTRYSVNNDTGDTLFHPGGSVLVIPKGAFRRANGDPVKGNLFVKYREFHDPIDIWASGIPMVYDSAGTHLFESAGMVEIRAEKDGEALTIDPANPVRLELLSYSEDLDHNVYYLDEQTGNWQYKGKDEVTRLDDLYTREDRGTDYPVESSRKGKVGIKPECPAALNPARYTFDLDVDTESFPWLNQFENVIFEVTDQQNFDPDIYNVQWSDAHLEEIEAGKLYTLILLNKDRRESLRVRPVLSGEDLDRAMEQYKRELENWKKEQVQADFSDAAALYKERVGRYESEDNALLAELAQQPSFSELIRRQRAALNTINERPRAYRGINISLLGIINCDRARPDYPNGKKKPVRFVNRATGAVILPAIVFLIEKGKNLIYSFTPERYQTQFSFNPGERNTLWTITKEGKIAVFREASFKVLNTENESYEIRLDISSQIIETKPDLIRFLGIDLNPAG